MTRDADKPADDLTPLPAATVPPAGLPTPSRVLRDEERARLVVLAGEGVGRKYDVGEGLLIGRSPNAAVRTSFSDVSREHARIRRNAREQFILEDLGSRNGTQVNGVPVTEQRLEFGDKIQVGANIVLLFTYHDRLEDQLLQSQKMESIGQLAGGIAHDFNNLLGAVMNNVDYLTGIAPDRKVGEAEVQECLEETRAAVSRAVALTNQLLGFARRGKYEEKPTDLPQLVAEVMEMARRTFDRAIDIVTDVKPGTMVLGDKSQLHQVLMNLMLNARDAMSDGGTLRVEARWVVRDKDDDLAEAFLAPGSYVLITVSDTGRGMDEDTCGRVFEPFFTTKGTGEGSGLGLATVYGIVKNHGGHVQVKSARGEGTTFRIYLPRYQAGEADTAAKVPTGDQPATRGGLVLLVDDEEMVRKSTGRLLRHLGYDLMFAEDGEEAVARYREHHERLRFVLLDLIMPRMSGAKVFHELRALDDSVPIVITTGYSDQEQARELLCDGAAGFLPKPFEVEELRELLATAMGQR